MPKILPIVGSEIDGSHGEPLLVFVARDENGQEIRFGFPAKAIQAVFTDSMQKLNAFAPNAAPAQKGEYVFAIARDPKSLSVGDMQTTDDDKVVLFVDRELPTESLLSISPQDAIDLARDLSERASEILTRKVQ